MLENFAGAVFSGPLDYITLLLLLVIFSIFVFVLLSEVAKILSKLTGNTSTIKNDPKTNSSYRMILLILVTVLIAAICLWAR